MDHNYFEKIEAYKTGTLSEVERLVFEEELAQNVLLQQEVAAYNLAEQLFDFVGETLPTETIVASEANETADLLISFTANKLSEGQIINTPNSTSTETIVRELTPKSNRTAWLVAASMLLILSLIGIQFYNTSFGTNDLDSTIVKTEPVEKTIMEPANVVAEVDSEAVSKESTSKANTVNESTPSLPKKVRKKLENKPLIISNSNQEIAKKILQKSPNKINLPTVEPTVIKLTAQEITTKKVVSTGEAMVYEGDNSVTLKAGFHAKAGANFVATASDKVTFLTNEVIEEQMSTVYEASQTITLKPGFHAKAGSNFIAKAKATDNLSTDVIVSPEEAVIFKAGNTIIFKPGFHAKPGAEVAAIVGK